MSKNSTAKKAQETEDFVKSHLFVVTPGTTPEDLKEKTTAEDVEFQEVTPEQETAEKETVDVMDVIKMVNAKYASGELVLPSEAERRKAEIDLKPVQTIEEIKRKAELLTRLSKKYDDLIDKLHRVEDFVISHDHETASVKVKDAMNYTFESNSPKTISKLIEFWKEEFTEAIENVEKEMREIA